MTWPRRSAPVPTRSSSSSPAAPPCPTRSPIAYRSARPQSSPAAKVAVTTQLVKTQVRMGEGVKLRAHVENTSASGVR